MGNENSKKLYIPFKQIMGRKNADGTYTLEAGDLKQLNDILYAICKKIMGGLTLSDLTVDTKTTFNDMVTFTDLATGGSTVINGDNIQTGTISADRVTGGTLQGVTIISSDGGNTEAKMTDGEITLKVPGSYLNLLRMGIINGSAMIWATLPSYPLKLRSYENMSIDVMNGTIFIGTDNGNVTIGNAGGDVRLVGNVYINGVLQQ